MWVKDSKQALEDLTRRRMWTDAIIGIILLVITFALLAGLILLFGGN